MASDTLDWLVPDWPAPAWIKAGSTGRAGGQSQSPYHSLNLGDHVGDDIGRVHQNRNQLKQALNLPEDPRWLNQIHGIDVVDVAKQSSQSTTADACFTTQKDKVCAVLTADCLPLLLCDKNGSRVAAVHAGWRGLFEGVIEAAIHRLACPAKQLLVWLGPAIGPQVFEVGHEVRQAFVERDKSAGSAFEAVSPGKYLADIYALARQRLQVLGIDQEQVYGGQYCSYSDDKRFFSYRRDGVTGRMATLIWMKNGFKPR